MHNSGARRRGNTLRRPGERRDPSVGAIALIAIAVRPIGKEAVRRLSCNNERLWLWVTAFAGTATATVAAARYRRSWNTGTSGLAAGILLISVTSSGGMVVIQSTHTMASNAAAAIVVSALLVNSGGSMVVLVAEDHPVL